MTDLIVREPLRFVCLSSTAVLDMNIPSGAASGRGNAAMTRTEINVGSVQQY